MKMKTRLSVDLDNRKGLAFGNWNGFVIVTNKDSNFDSLGF